MVYIKKVSTTDKRFGNRAIEVCVGSTPIGDVKLPHSSIPVPDTVVLCNGCNNNVYPGSGYLVYLGKRELDKDLPYDFYCDKCTHKYFPKATLVS